LGRDLRCGKAHVFAAERIHGDDTTVPVLAKVKTRTGRIWTYVRDDRPFGGAAPPAAVFFYSPDRASIHPEQHLAGYCGILQADAYAGFNRLYAPDRKPGPITEAGCWAHARRKLFELADIAAKARKQKPTTVSPIAFVLLDLAKRAAAEEIEVPMSRQDIADYLGLTIETISRTLTQLEAQAAIALPTSRRIVLCNRCALTRLDA
jgi:transposase